MKARRELHEKSASLIKAHPAFCGAPQETVSRVLIGDSAILRDVAKAAPVLPCHSPKNAAALLLTGKCHICVDGKIIDIKKQGAFLGMEKLFGLESADEKIVSAESCKVLYLKREAVEEIVKSSLEAEKCFNEWLSDTADKLKEKEQTQINSNSEKILAEYFLSKRRNEKGEIRLPTDMQKIAKHLGLNKDSFFAALQALNSSGAIALKGSSIYTDTEKLNGFIK